MFLPVSEACTLSLGEDVTQHASNVKPEKTCRTERQNWGNCFAVHDQHPVGQKQADCLYIVYSLAMGFQPFNCSFLSNHCLKDFALKTSDSMFKEAKVYRVPDIF